MSLRRCESPGVIAQIAALSVDHAPTAIIGCPYTSRHDRYLREGGGRLDVDLASNGVPWDQDAGDRFGDLAQPIRDAHRPASNLCGLDRRVKQML
jgi:hypothetical protein